MFKCKGFREVIQEQPEILIHIGRLDYKMLAKLTITNDELDEVICEHGIDHVKDVKLAILEIDGNSSIISGEGVLKQTHYKRRHNRKNLVGM